MVRPIHVTAEPNQFNPDGSAPTLYFPKGTTLTQVQDWVAQDEDVRDSTPRATPDEVWQVERTRIQPFPEYPRFQVY